jgi:hypothetical protein
MRLLLALLSAIVLLGAPAAYAQSWGQIEGRVTEAGTGEPIPGANILVAGTEFGTAADGSGSFRLRMPAGRYALRVSAVGYATRTDSVTVRRDATTRLDIALAQVDLELGGVEVQAAPEVAEAGVSRLDPRTAQNIPTPLPDGFRALQVLMGVATSTETSYQYSVRGGGYNENLYFIDGFEVYTPFRTRQGEQEGLGLVNLDITERLTLYTGGFPARYGGKLSSALDVRYLRPTNGMGGTAYASGLDAGGALHGGMLGGRLGLAVAARHSRPGGFFGTQEMKGEYDPIFTDVQGTATLRLAEGHELHGIGFYLNHRFRLDPQRRRTYFGTFQDLRSVSFAYHGFEEDGYDLGFIGLRLVSRLNNRIRIEHDVSYFDVTEFEEYDISGNVALFRIDNVFADPNDPTNLIATGAASQRDYADNRVRVASLTGGGRYRLALGRHAAEAGWSLRQLRFDDQLDEGTELAGRDDDGSAITVRQALQGAADFDEFQGALFASNSVDLLAERGRLVLTTGLRADYFSFNEEWTLSPRLSGRLALNPLTTLTAATGLYHQAPTYRELRGEPIYSATSENLILDALNRNLRSQRAGVATVGVERFFPRIRFYGRAEAYYKHLRNLISYDVQHVRTVYSGENDAEGYTYGLDLQIRGEFVPGMESWLNYGFMVARERFLPEFAGPLRQGEIARPTDRRHNVSMFVQDYVPASDSWRLHMRALFGTGTPYTPPTPGQRIGNVDVQDPGPRAGARYPEYRRFDMGLTKESQLAASGPDGNPITMELTAEVLNVFNMTNTIAYSWIAGSDGIWQRVPTRLTPRQLNVRLRVRF